MTLNDEVDEEAFAGNFASCLIQNSCMRVRRATKLQSIRYFTVFESGRGALDSRKDVCIYVALLASLTLNTTVDIFSTTLNIANITDARTISPYIRVQNYKRHDLFKSNVSSSLSRFALNQTEWCKVAQTEDTNTTKGYLEALVSFSDMVRLVLCDNNCFYFDADAIVVRPIKPGLSMFPMTTLDACNRKMTEISIMENPRPPHFNNNFFAFFNSNFYEDIIANLVTHYQRASWGCLGTDLFEDVWKIRKCDEDTKGDCPLVYTAPFSCYPGYLKDSKSFAKVAETQPVFHHYSQEKGLWYLKDFVKLLIPSKRYEKLELLYQNFRSKFKVSGPFDPIKFCCSS